MDIQTLQAEVVSHFPSHSYKRYLAESGYRFSPEDLMAAIFDFVPTFEERIRLFSLLAEISPEVANQTRLIIAWQRRILRAFQTPEEGMLYVLEIMEAPDEEPYDYLCTDWESCLEMIDRHFERFFSIGSSETEQTRYTITKRRLYRSGQDPDELHDTAGEVHLLPGKVIGNVFLYDSSNEFGLYGDHPDLTSVMELYPKIPAWFPNGSVVRTLDPCQEVYAIAMTSHRVWNDSPDLYLVPITPELPRHLDQETYDQLHDHMHVSSPHVELISPEDLPPELLDSYLGLYEYLVENP